MISAKCRLRAITYCGVEIVQQNSSFPITSITSFEWGHFAVDVDVDVVQGRELFIDTAFDTDMRGIAFFRIIIKTFTNEFVPAA